MTEPPPHDPYATRAPAPADSTPAPAADTSSIRFRILRPHAQGGLGEVLVARDAELNREVALKQIQPRYANDPESQGRFLLEAEITGGLEHPSIVPVYGLGHYADGRPYYAMRFIRGDSLQEAVQRFHQLDVPGRDPGERSLELRNLLGRLVDVCNAIAYAHSRGVLHRDLKPGNIMVGKYGETLVVDWGLAKPVDGPPEPQAPTQPGEGVLRPASASHASQTMAGSAVGTPHFMSPEQAAGRLDLVGPASDVYSLGATLYTLLTGQPPVSDTDTPTVLRKVREGDVVPPRKVKPNVPPPLDAICRKAMALEPVNRYATPRDLADDVEHWLADEPVSAWREPWTMRARRWISRNRIKVTAIASTVLMATVALAIIAIVLKFANDRERAARQLAEDNFRLAKSAVDRYHTEVSEDVLLHEPGMEPLRHRLLGAAREFYTKFVDERRDEPGLQAELGKALFRLGQITGDIGDQHEAIKLHQQAIETLTALPNEQADLARAWHHLGRLYRLIDQPAPAEEAYTQALAIWSARTAADPDDETLQADEARSRLGLGNVYQVTRKLDDAATLYDHALATRKRLAKAHPDVAEYQRDAAISHANRARIHDLQGEADEALKAYGAALGYQESLVKEHKHISQYQDDLATTHFNIGDLNIRGGDAKEAEASYTKAATIWTELEARHPAVTQFQVKLGESQAALARVYLAAREMKKATTAAAAALAISERVEKAHPDQPRYEANMALRHVQLGDVHRAASQIPAAAGAYGVAIHILDRLTHKIADVPQHRADLARTYNKLGLLFMMGDRKRAEEALRQSLANWERLVKDYHGEPEYVLGQSSAALNLGDLLRTTDWAAGIDWYTQALQFLDALRPDQQQTPAIQAALGLTHWRRAEMLSQAGRHRDALPDWQRAAQLVAGPRNAAVRLERAAALAHAGAHTEATAEADALAVRPEVARAGTALYKLGRVYAVAMRAAARDAGRTATNREASATRYAGRAVELLRRAQSAGYFTQAKNRELLSTDADLAALRDDAGFRQWLQGLMTR